MEIPKDERQRTEPGGQRNRAASAERRKPQPEQTRRTAQQTPRQKRIGRDHLLQKSKEWVGQQNNSADHGKGELKTSREKFVRVPAEKKECGRGQSVQRKNLSFEEEATKQDRTHHRRPKTGNVQPGDGCIKKKKRNDERSRPSAR